MLEIKALKAGIDGKMILNGIDLVIPDGEVHAIMGPNGSGKSTLGYVLAGREGYDVQGGTATFNGHDLLEMEPEARAARSFGSISRMFSPSSRTSPSTTS